MVFPTEHLDIWLAMSQRDGFSTGFFLGTIVGGIVGGVVGSLLTAKQFTESDDAALNGIGLNSPSVEPKPSKRKRLLKASGHTDMETARRSLEDKIAQLNEAIDDVRQQLGGVNVPTREDVKSAIAPDQGRQA